MIREQYKPLCQAKLDRCASYHQAEPLSLRSLTLDSPALDVMTDFNRGQAVTIGPEPTLIAVNTAMMRNTVRSLLVAEKNASGRQMTRGIFSASQIACQLGMAINATQIPSTFAEIEAAIAH